MKVSTYNSYIPEIGSSAEAYNWINAQFRTLVISDEKSSVSWRSMYSATAPTNFNAPTETTTGSISYHGIKYYYRYGVLTSAKYDFRPNMMRGAKTIYYDVEGGGTSKTKLEGVITEILNGYFDGSLKFFNTDSTNEPWIT